MMSRPNGEGVPTPIVTMPRRKTRVLDDAAVRRVRDLLYALLIDGAGLTVAEAAAVMDGRLDRTQVYRRQRAAEAAVARHGAWTLLLDEVNRARHAG